MRQVRDRIGRSGVFENCVPLVGAQVANTGGTVVAVTPGTSNTPGAYAQLFAATTADAHWLSLTWNATTGTGVAQTMLADIAIGAAAAEVDIVPSIAVGGQHATGWNRVLLPVFIPAGSRLAIRMTTAAGTTPSPTVSCILYGASPLTPHHRSPPKLVAVGANVAASTGDCQISSNNTYVQITAATTQPFQGVVMSHCINDSNISAVDQTLTLGVGASGAEATLAEDMGLTNTSEASIARTGFPTVLRPIPTGARLAAKSTNGSTNTWTVIPIGIPYL